MLKSQVIGNLGQDAETREVGGKTVISFSVAHTEKYKDKTGEYQTRTVWVKCSKWTTSDKLGIVPYLRKGTQVYVEGEPSVEGYVNRDGACGASLNLRVTDIVLLGGKNEPQAAPVPQPQAAPVSTSSEPKQQPNPSPVDYSEDDLPF